jgi:WD40 repeat protein
VTAGGDWIAVIDAVTRPVAIQRSTGRSYVLTDRPNLWNAAVSPDGRWLAAGTYQGRGIDLWEVATGRINRQIWDAAVNSRCEFSPDGHWLAVTSSHEFRVFDTTDWNVVYSRFNTDAFYTTVPLAFTPDGQHLLMSENQIDLHLLRTGTWQQVATLRGPDTGVHGVARFSADGRWLVRTSGSEVHVWNFGKLRDELHRAGVNW